MTQKTLIIVLVGIIAILWSTVFFVKETERAMVFQLGEIKRDDLKPGLHLMIPFINNVRKFDARILTMDAQPERFLTSEKKNVEVDFFVKWKIQDVKRYYKASLGDRARAEARITQIVKDELKNQFGIRTIQQAISGERDEIMSTLEVKSQALADQLGIKLVDVRISRIELPTQVSDSVYERMRAERKRTVIIAEAYKKAETERGLGDAKSAKIYANAYNKDPEFYSFTRSLNAYIQTFQGKNDVLVVEPDSEFFKYFKGDQ